LKDRRPFAFAGLWDQWKDSLTGEVIRSFTIITCPPNDFMRLLHDRMPLILPSSHWSEWLDPRERSPEELARALVPLDDTQMREELCGDPRQLEEAAQRGSLSLS
jgi:putative SOS response-associated peptidase YedK